MSTLRKYSPFERFVRELMIAPTNRQVAAFKYRYKSREGNMEDSPPIMSQSLRTLAGPASGKFRCD